MMCKKDTAKEDKRVIIIYTLPGWSQFNAVLHMFTTQNFPAYPSGLNCCKDYV